mmetsp:Transcript_9986/g.23357  ORF Transcript_9986/g.23357 Transcript_9986/m.23357 type:complete len:410 (+) Transcript_9986:236-1465(+)
MSTSTKKVAAAVPSTITILKPGHAWPMDIYDDDDFPNLRAEYMLMAQREKESLESLGGDYAEKLPADGRITEISGVDFTETLPPLEEEDESDEERRTKLPFRNDHLINVFFAFTYKLLCATDSGTVGGNACRQNRVIMAALNDIDGFLEREDQIHLLFGLLLAMKNHGLYETLDRGDPYLLRSIFGAMAKDFKRFNEEKYADQYGVSDDLRKMINSHCKGFQFMLKSTKKTINEYAETYTFNYIRIPRAAKSKENSANGEKRKSVDGTDSVGLKPAKKSKPPTEVELLMERINAVEGVPADPIVYDSCTELRAKIRSFLDRKGVTKKNFCAALGNINSNSLNRLLKGQGQDQKGNVAYVNSYVFFEKMRLMEDRPKSAVRLRNEDCLEPTGFDVTKSKGGGVTRYVYRR